MTNTGRTLGLVALVLLEMVAIGWAVAGPGAAGAIAINDLAALGSGTSGLDPDDD